MNILQINQAQIFAFVLVFLRCSAFSMSWPLFSGQSVPVQLKVLLSLLLGFICFAVIKPSQYPAAEHFQTMIGLSVKELIIGLALGFLANLVFFAVSISGELISMSMGLSAAQIFNPSLGFQQSSLNQLYFYLAAFTFLAMNGHHYLIQGLFKSFSIVPLHVFMPRLNEVGSFFMLGGRVMELGLLLAAPIMVSILIVNFALGIMGRAVPQVNVLITSLPINALLGLLMLIVVLPFYLDNVRTGFEGMMGALFAFLKTF